MKLLLLALLALLPLTASSKYDNFSPPTEDTVIVHVRWMSPEEVHKTCLGDRTIPENMVIRGCFYNNTIIAVQPKDFNDLELLMILGHEFLHALGANHEELGQAK